MPRPTLLVAEPAQAPSARKLVLETGNFNVLTAHSNREALDICQLFPNVSAAVLVGDTNIDCDDIDKHIKSTTDKITIIHLHASIGGRCAYADQHLSSHEPELLLELVRSLLVIPEVQVRTTSPLRTLPE
jgi:hypothetical protein